MMRRPARLCHNRFGAVSANAPRTGKLWKGTLGLMTTTNSVAALETVTQKIIELVWAEVGMVELSAASTLESVGLDSLKVMALIFKIEAHYDILLEEDDADDLRTVGDLAALVVRRIEERP